MEQDFSIGHVHITYTCTMSVTIHFNVYKHCSLCVDSFFARWKTKNPGRDPPTLDELEQSTVIIDSGATSAQVQEWAQHNTSPGRQLVKAGEVKEDGESNEELILLKLENAEQGTEINSEMVHGETAENNEELQEGVEVVYVTVREACGEEGVVTVEQVEQALEEGEMVGDVENDVGDAADENTHVKDEEDKEKDGEDEKLDVKPFTGRAPVSSNGK